MRGIAAAEYGAQTEMPLESTNPQNNALTRKRGRPKAANTKTSTPEKTPETKIPISMEVKDEKLVSRMREIIKSSDLTTTTTKMIRTTLETVTSFMCFQL